MVNRYRSPAEVEFRNKYNNPRFGRPGLFSKTDVVPSAARYMEDLRNLQLKYFAEFIRGERPLAEFDRFVADWQRGGGAQLTEEANRMYQVQQKLVSRMKTPEPTSQPEDGKE
jgi:hypothetical protein